MALGSVFWGLFRRAALIRGPCLSPTNDQIVAMNHLSSARKAEDQVDIG
jgi:hypothetical protein